eukprot:Gb_30233 [translate_table: standard]
MAVGVRGRDLTRTTIDDLHNAYKLEQGMNEIESSELEKLSPKDLARQNSAEWVEGGTDGLIGLSRGGLGLCSMQAAAIAFYILFSLFVNSFVIIFVVTVWLAALERVLPTHKEENESSELEKLSPRGLARQSSAEWVEGGTDGLIGLSRGGLGLCPMQAAAITFYILFSLFVNSFVIIFVVTVWLAALDFWVVKNVSGRILVGLRWWNEINEQGESIWKFASLDQ